MSEDVRGLVTVVVGPPCGGKSTWVRETKQAGDVVVDYDLMAQALGSDAPHAAPDAVASVAFAARSAAIARVLKGVGADAWIIHTSPSPEQMALYAEAGALVVEIDPGQDACMARAEADGRPDGTHEVIQRWYERRAAAEPQE